MATNNENQNSGLGGFIVLWILLTVQTGAFAIMVISACDIKAIRIFTAFIGIGLAVFPMFVRKTYLEDKGTKDADDTLNVFQRLRRKLQPYWFLLMMLISMLFPWISWLMARHDGVGLVESVVPAAIMQLSAGSISFGISGLVLMLKELKTESWKFNLFRIIIILPTIAYGCYIAAPGVLIFVQWLLAIMHSPTMVIANLLHKDQFWLETARTIGYSALYWFISFAFCVWANFQIYKNAFIKR